jgi:hypothetical protein
MLDLALLNVLTALAKEATDVSDNILTVLVGENIIPESAHLLVVVIRVVVGVATNLSIEELALDSV